jgi:hypothetical protein
MNVRNRRIFFVCQSLLNQRNHIFACLRTLGILAETSFYSFIASSSTSSSDLYLLLSFCCQALHLLFLAVLFEQLLLIWIRQALNFHL